MLPVSERRPPASAAPPWQEFAQSPLVPVALAATLGLIVDRFVRVQLETEFLIVVAGGLGWIFARQRYPEFAILCLWGCFAGLAGAHHQIARTVFPADDIARVAQTQAVLVRVRGIVIDPPVARRSNSTEVFGPARRVNRVVTLLDLRAIRAEANVWQSASGRVRLSVEEVVQPDEPPPLDAIRVGDEVEVVGQFSRPATPSNPGEWDYADHLLDERIRGELRVTNSVDAVVRLDDSGREVAILANLRRTLNRRIEEALPPREAAIARALLLGETSAMDRDDWDAFARTGVVHVLAISGQHLVILAGFVWWAFRIVGVSRRSGALAVIVLIVGYAVLTGMRPSATRAAVMVVAMCGAILFRRTTRTANLFALAWLAVIIWNPTDLFSSGCQLSFLSVFVLIWGTGRWFRSGPPTPREELLAESRSLLGNLLRQSLRIIGLAFAVTLVLTIVNAPIIMLRQNLVPPVGVLIGPLLVLLSSLALLAGFALLLLGPLPPLAFLATQSLALCDVIVQFADRIPGGSVYVPTPPVWWVIGFYGIAIASVLLADRRWLLGLLVWTSLGLIGVPRGSSDELRVTFLAVGHGGCTVLELPDGRVFLYDAGTMAGPDVVRRVIAPYLWHRGYRHIDELFLSHADLDHFNGVVELIRRFPVGQVTLSPSFASKPTQEVAEVLLALAERQVPRRIAAAGDRFAAGSVEFEVLHPPLEGPDGTENERSLVLHVQHGAHSLLLTGDLEKAGMQRVLGLPPRVCDGLMAPHHGSRLAFSGELLKWCSPAFIAVNRGNRSAIQPADAPGIPMWDTWTAGAITLRSNPTGITAEAFRTGERLVVRRGR